MASLADLDLYNSRMPRRYLFSWRPLFIFFLAELTANKNIKFLDQPVHLRILIMTFAVINISRIGDLHIAFRWLLVRYIYWFYWTLVISLASLQYAWTQRLIILLTGLWPSKRLTGGKCQCHINLWLLQQWLTLGLLNKLRCHAHFQFTANQITWSRLLIQIHILNGKQCRSRSVCFFRSQLIWIYTVCKGRVYPGSAGQGLKGLYSPSSMLISD